MPIRQTFKLALACAALSVTASHVALADSTQSPSAPQTELTSDFVYKYLIGELAGQRGDVGLASNLFLDLAKSSRDPRLAERAAKTAVYANQPGLALQAADLWAKLDPNSIEAQQAATQLLIGTGKLAEAKPHLVKLLQKEDTRANGFLYLNSLLAKYPNKDEVLMLVQDLAAPYPNLAEAHFTIAHSAWEAGKTDLALSELDTAEKLHPGWEIGALLRGQILLANSPADTLTFYRKFLEKHPDANEVRLTMARLLVNQKRFEEAKFEFMKLVEASHGNPEVLVVVGLLSLQAGNYAQAESYLQQALQADFKDKDQIYLYLGQIAEKQNQDEQAMTWYKKIEPGSERYLDAQFDIAGIIARTQSVDAALAMLDNLQDLSLDQMAPVVQAKASLLNQAKRYQEAYDMLGKAVAEYPNTPEIIYDYAMTAERLQHLDVMETELRKLIQMRPDFAQAYNALGYTLADRNINLDEAEKLISKALALRPNDHYILDSMGWVQYRRGELDKAADYLRRAYTTETDPEIAAHLGEVLWQQGKYDEATQTLDQALREHPESEVLINAAKKFNKK
ncbi:MAG TPA: tetratricopeptide repeat protein [Methylophilaceae bacterium]|nr:tetratricopeptide repeat protein [Methylophilaceae bacterium]